VAHHAARSVPPFETKQNEIHRGCHMPSHLDRRYLVFRLNDQAYVLPTPAVEEIVSMAELTRPPCAPSLLAGFLNFGGDPVAVIDLRHLFELPPCEPDLYTPLIVLKCEAPRIALQVDAVSQIIGESDGKMMPLGDRCCLNDTATATLEVEGKKALLLSPERLLIDAERQRLTQLQQLERQRLATLQETVSCS